MPNHWPREGGRATFFGSPLCTLIYRYASDPALARCIRRYCFEVTVFGFRTYRCFSSLDTYLSISWPSRRMAGCMANDCIWMHAARGHSSWPHTKPSSLDVVRCALSIHYCYFWNLLMTVVGVTGSKVSVLRAREQAIKLNQSIFAVLALTNERFGLAFISTALAIRTSVTLWQNLESSSNGQMSE